MNRTDAGSRLAAPDDALLAALEETLPGAVRSRATDRLGYAHDASHYLLTPQAVVVPDGAAQVAALLQTARRMGAHLTFRSGGTSLSGQAGTAGVLVDTRRHFRDVQVLDDGARVRVQPGVTLRQVNARLTGYGRKLGPDPASESACTVGGVVANNSSGMTCGTRFNAYATLESAVLVMPSGTVIDTGAPDADARLAATEPVLVAGLERLRDRVRSNAASVATLRHQFSMKNTMGYGLNAFLDHDTPARLLTALVVGSEGTLAFIAEATFRTVPAHPLASTGLVVFESLAEAMASMSALVDASPAAIELLDAESLRVAQTDPAADPALRALQVRAHAALLVEWQDSDTERLADATRAAGRVFADLPTATPAQLSADPAGRAALWHIRKGLYATVAGARPSGTTALLEDVAVPVADLASLCVDLASLFDRHGYERSVIFGHAKDGNLHFMLNERFTAGRPDRYAAFTEDLVDAVLTRGGTLKAEHGTGRVMAPYVRRQYGDELYDVMVVLKRLCDPAGVLNPGVILTEDDALHLRDLKVVDTVEPEVDRCVECGYCEPVCPSRDLTTTPRQRIVLRREMAAAEKVGDHSLLATLRAEYQYDAVDTCAVDGMCATACPVLINTGDLTKRLRAEAATRPSRALWSGAAKAWDPVTAVMSRALDVAAMAPAPIVERVGDAFRAVVDHDLLPQWRRDVPAGGRRRRPDPTAIADAVYVPSCLNTLFAPADGGSGVLEAVRALAARAGITLHTPDGVAGLCCGTPWSSKGMRTGFDSMQRRVRATLEAATDGGRLPVVTDAASCTEGFERLLATAGPDITVLDAVPFVAHHILPGLTVTRRQGSLALHPTCSSRRLQIDDAVLQLARAVADDVVVPQDWQCCAFAGDRGLLHPELTASATRAEAAEVNGRSFDAYASVNRTCEIGMTRATGRPYRHLLELVELATRENPGQGVR